MSAHAMKSADVVVIGAGLLGLASAYWLAKDGAKVIVLEKGRVAWEASSRATGFLSLRGEEPREVPLAAEANRLWMDLDQELGYPTEWLSGGRLWVACDELRWSELQRTYQIWTKSGIPVRMIDAKEAREIAPCLTQDVLGAVHTSRGGHANPQRTAQAFAWAVRDRGGEILPFTAATGIEVRGGKVSAVQTSEGMIGTGMVVSCAGPQTALIGRMVGIEVPVAAARMETMVTAPLPPLFQVALVGNGVSVRQTRRGNLHFNGGPHEWVDVDLTSEPAKPNTPLIRNVARRLAELFPSIADVPLLRSWAGIVEISPDHACIIEQAGSPQGMIIATASGHGFGLCPSMGKAISELVINGRSTIPIDGLGLSRFGNLDPSWRADRKWTAGAYNT